MHAKINVGWVERSATHRRLDLEGAPRTRILVLTGIWAETTRGILSEATVGSTNTFHPPCGDLLIRMQRI